MKNKVLLSTGFFFILLGIFLNEWVIATILSPDGFFESWALKIRIVTFELFLMGIGACIVKYHRTISIQRKNLCHLGIGLSFIAFGILFNVWVAARIFGLYTTSAHIGIWIGNMLAILLGYLIVRYRNHEIVTNCLVLGFSLCVSLILLELLLGYVAPPVVQGVGTEHTEKARLYGWALPPHQRLAFVHPDNGDISYFTTNSQGWKDVEHQFEKPEDIFRILFLGDSVTYGVVTLEDLYTRKVEMLLKTRGISNVEVISIGVGGWGTDQSLEVLMQEGIRYEPDLVIYQFCGNDVTDNLPPLDNSPDALQRKKPFQYTIQNGKLMKMTRQVNSVSTHPPILKKSALCYHLSRLRTTIFYRFKETGDDKAQWEPGKTFHWWKSGPVDPTFPYYLYSAGEEMAELQEAWRLLEALILKMKAVAENNNAQFVVFSEESDEGKRQWNLRWDRFATDGLSDYVLWEGKRYAVDWKRPLKNLVSLCNAQNIPIIQPVRIYERYEYDPHPNALGNIHMAEDIVEFILINQMLVN